MLTRSATTILNTGLLTVLIFLSGCAGQKEVFCPWRSYSIIVNGIDDEWQNAPQYYDKDRNLTIRVANDANALFLCVSTGDNALIKKLHMTGLTVWLDPQGGKEKIFGIHLPGERPKSPGRKPPPDSGNFKPQEEREPPDDFDGIQSPSPRTPTVLDITYKNSTGPLDMTIDEVRRTGIDIGVGQSQNGRLAYEFSIGFRAAPCLSSLKPGMDVGVGIESGTGERNGRKKKNRNDPMSPGRPGGGDWSGRGFGEAMGRPPGGPDRDMPGGSSRMHPDEKEDPLEIWLKVQMAGQNF